MFKTRKYRTQRFNMYSGLLPPGLTEADLSSDDGDGEGVTSENRQVQTDEHLSLQLGTEAHSIRLQDEYNNTTKTDSRNYDASGDECLPGVSLDNWQRFKDLQRAKDDQRMKQPQTKRQRKRRHKKGGTQNCDTEQKREPEEKQEEHWKELTQYFGINDRLKPPPCSRPPLMLAVKIAQAADCRDFASTKQEAEASRAAQKRRKQIAWGFEAKKRWETKSNMGFM
ncbi:protein FAM204A isoform X2 [Siphateles boraxobius]|uniref:protein FAM204A isoform X2 n=1 Tax=Siphateles boraxobius TaxID=180520 RepID=UPI004064C7B5